MKIPMSSNLNKINFCIIGKPNSGKSTLFNCLLDDSISPVGDEYGLTKNLFKDKFTSHSHDFTIFDTPGLRRKNKINDLDEKNRNKEVITLVDKVDVVILLIDSVENITKQDFRLADLAITKKKIIFFLFNKMDLIDEGKKFKTKIDKYLSNNYSQYQMINTDFISAKKNIRIKNFIKQIINKNKLVHIEFTKTNLNKFLNYLNKQSKYPKIKKREIKPKYIVQIKTGTPLFKVFINSKKKAPLIFQRFFDNAFRDFFKIKGVPISYQFISSNNPYSD
jgi:GTP-binding protein